MDEMKLKLSTRLLKGVVAKLLSRLVYSKTGCKVNIHIDELDVWMLDGNTTVRANLELKMKSEEFKRLMTEIDKE